MTEPELKLDEEIPDSFLETGEVKKEETLRIQHVAWDFGVDLSEEIEAEKISGNKQIVEPEEEKVFGEQINETVEEEEKIIPEEIENTVEEIISEELPNISEQINSETEIEIIEEEISQPHSVTEEIEEGKTDKFETTDDELRISSEAETSSEELLEESVQVEKINFEYEDESDEKKSSKYFEEVKPDELHEEIEEQEFEEIQSTEQTIETEKSERKETISDKFEIVNDQKEVSAENEPLSVSDEQKDEIKPEIDEDKELKKVREELYSYQPRKSKVPLLIVLIGSIIILGMLYFYITQIKNVAIKKSEPTLVLKTDKAFVVERDFSVPVSYPYPKRVIEEITTKTVIDSVNTETKVIDKSSEQKTESITEKKDLAKTKPVEQSNLQKQTNNVVVPAPTVNYERVAPNIFKYKDYYVVQVAAFRSNSIAENEAAKFRNKGYNAFVEKAELQDMGVWFRVRVGNFPTLREAQEFQLKVKL
jgi:cell division septation protein DedD